MDPEAEKKARKQFLNYIISRSDTPISNLNNFQSLIFICYSFQLFTGDAHSRDCNPEHKESGSGRPAGYQGDGSKKDLENHSNQLNPNHPEYKKK